ncbi:protein disulfide-isomerase A3-like [Zophobas morio]|uniref:protein disulfide-isomerase A3-like n=1 Tax=Zophobas morio TaxID=2755281 RepID=UPI003083DD89
MPNPAALLLLSLSLHFSLCKDPNVLQLTDTNFSHRLKQNPVLLVAFFIPWCGPCQKMRPQYSRAANILKGYNLPVALGKLDCSGLGKRTCEQKQIGHHFPVIHLYRNGSFVKEYTNTKDCFGFVKFMRVQILPSAVELKSVDEFKKFIKGQEDVVVVGFFEEESRLRKMFFKVAEKMKERIFFAYTRCEKVLLREGVNNGIVLFRPEITHCRYEEERVLFTGRVVIGEIKNFIIKNYYGLVGCRSPANIIHFPNPLIILYYTVDYNSSGKEPGYWRLRMLKVAHKYQKYVKFVTSAKDDFEEELVDYPVEYGNLMRPFVLAKDLENKKYIMTEEFTSENFDRFVDDFVHHRLEQYHKSKPVPFEGDGVTVMASTSNFNNTVTNNGKDTLLHFYDPGNHTSRLVAMVLREAAHLLLEEDVVVVTMDIGEHEIPPIFPEDKVESLYWLPKDDKENPILYTGRKEVEDVIQFVAEKATTKLKNYDRDGNPTHVKDEL